MQATIRVGILFVLSLAGVPGRAAPMPASMHLTISRTLQTNGEPRYLVDAFSSGLATLQMPDGTKSISGFPVLDRGFNSFSDLESAVVGNWGISFNSPAEHYDFSIAAFPESVFSSTPPIITSPADGAAVPGTFTITWQWPPGVQPAAHSIFIQESRSGHSTGTSTFDEGSSALSKVISPDTTDGEDQLVLSVGTLEETLVPYVSPVTSDQTSPRFAFTVVGLVSSYSLPVTVSLVPEPTTATLLLLGMLGCRFRRRQNRH